MDAVLSFSNGMVLPGILYFEHEIYSSSFVKLCISNEGISMVIEKKIILVFVSIMVMMTLPFLIMRTLLLESDILLVKRHKNGEILSNKYLNMYYSFIDFEMLHIYIQFQVWGIF